MSHINDLVLEGLITGGIGAVAGGAGRLLANTLGNHVGNMVMNTGFPATSIGASILSSGIPFGNVVTGLYGAGQQAYLNKLRDEYNQASGMQTDSTRNKLWNGIKTGLSGLISSVPIVGTVHNAVLGSKIANLQSKMNGMIDARNYNNSISPNPQPNNQMQMPNI